MEAFSDEDDVCDSDSEDPADCPFRTRNPNQKYDDDDDDEDDNRVRCNSSDKNTNVVKGHT